MVGVKLLLPSGPTARLYTPSNQMSIQDIVSQTADKLTGNNWSAFIGLQSDILPERVQDGARPVHRHLHRSLFSVVLGVIELRFNAPVNLEVLQRNLKASTTVVIEAFERGGLRRCVVTLPRTTNPRK